MLLIALLVGARLYLNVWLLRYVNNVLANIEGYEGSVEDIDIALYRGAYRIHGLKLFRDEGGIPVPFLAADTIDLSVQWGALFHGRIVSDAELIRPVINFAIARNGQTAQTGEGVDWSEPIKELMPIDINLVTIHEGTLTYKDYSTNPRVNIYIRNMEGEIHNLRNVIDESQPLPSWLTLSGDSIGGGRLRAEGEMNILRPIPDMDLDVRLEHVDLKALSDYTNAYAAIDIRKGKLDVYSELVIKDNNVSGYVKPIATDVALIDLRKSTNPVKIAWEVVAATVIQIFTNQPKDQFATKVPLEGSLEDIDTNMWVTLGGIVRNAFIKAFDRGIDHEEEEGR